MISGQIILVCLATMKILILPSISEEPVAAASLAQVYLATLNDGKDTKVAVKVQRPSVLGTVSKDLYVLRRAAEVFQGLVERFAPQQRYVSKQAIT